ncbi:MAG: phosphotransferase [Deltaproteobacteria bacterium]|nr:phosphotransferase [Deltaproteobacteria bacterium]
MTQSDLPPVDPGRLRDLLRAHLGSDAIGFSELPTLLGQGGEAVVEAFALRGAEDPRWNAPLVLRRLMAQKDPVQLRWEAAVHEALGELGYPVPRVLHVETDPKPLGAPFLVAERVPGEVMLQAVTRPTELARKPHRFPSLIFDALFRVPKLLAESQARLHGLDPTPLREGLTDAGLSPREVRFDTWLARIGQNLRNADLDGLVEGHVWLERHRPSQSREVIGHGDFVFTNLCVEGGRVSGVFDWSTVGLAEREWDVAATLARLRSNVPGMPPWVDAITRRVQAGMVRRYLAAYEACAPLDPERLRYYDAYWLLYELTRSGERLRAGGEAGEAIETRWLHPETIAKGVREFRELTGVELEPLLPS